MSRPGKPVRLFYGQRHSCRFFESKQQSAADKKISHKGAKPQSFQLNINHKNSSFAPSRLCASHSSKTSAFRFIPKKQKAVASTRKQRQSN
jgi:hypothetical protein